MAYTWIRVKEVGDGSESNPYRPKYSDQVDGWSGQRIGNSPQFVCRLYGDSQTLSDIESQDDVKTLTEDKAVDLLKNAGSPGLKNTDRPWDKNEMKNRFSVNSDGGG